MTAYVRRLLADGGQAADALFARLLRRPPRECARWWRRGSPGQPHDEPIRTAFLLANDLSLVLLHRQIAWATGTDPLTRDGLARWTAAVMDVYTGGVFAAARCRGSKHLASRRGRGTRSGDSGHRNLRLGKSYGPIRAVIGLDLVVEPGQVFAFLGPNGAGKTTTIRMLLALQRPSRGTAAILGLDCARDSVQIHRRIGYLPGELALYPRMTGRQHIAWHARARGLRDLSLARTLAERFDAVLDRPARELSTGNRQKVGLVLAFMQPAGPARARRADLGPGPADAQRVRPAGARGDSRGQDRVLVLARARRGAAPGRPGRDHQARPAHRHRDRRAPARQHARRPSQARFARPVDPALVRRDRRGIGHLVRRRHRPACR